MNRIAPALALVVSLAGAAAARQGTPTVIPATPLIQPGQPAQDDHAKAAQKPKIYDESADAKQVIAAAEAKAKKDNRRVLIQWGANWCPWCHMLHAAFAKNPISKEILYEYDVVLVDVGRFDKNMDIADSYGAKLKETGIPYLTILDGSGKVLANQDSTPLEKKGPDGKSLGGPDAGHDPAAVMEFLKAQRAPYLQADAVFKDGMDQAKASGRKVFLHFGAPWCGWCHRLENWLAQDEITRTFAKDYIDLKIDQDRMIGAKEVEAKYEMPSNSGIPWFVIIDPQSGKVLTTSTAPTGNIGYPGEPDEIEYFMGMIEKTKKNLTPSDLERLKESLAAEAQKIKSTH